MSKSLSPGAAHLGMLLWAVLVGLSFPAVGVMSELPPFSLTALRFVIACSGLWWLARRSPAFLPAWRQLPLYALMGLCLAGFFGAMFWAAHHATALSMATLFVTVPLLAFLLGLGFGVERLAWRLPAVLSLGAVGALGLAFAESLVKGGRLQFGIGEAVFFLGCLSTALYPVLSKWGLATGRLPTSAAVRTFWSLGLGAVLIGLLGLAAEPVERLATMSGRDLLLLVYLGLFSTALTFWLLQRATSVLTPGAVTAYSYFVPFVSMLLLFVREPERIAWVWLPGSLLVIIAMVLLMKRDAA
ncbi:DMT family transporter [Halomonas lysinitropha]|uniref:Putative DMT superfamily transporter inner membrane protein n=1 Tax=Halomonas lysinitropha TaxID=2607506 RepID=A0A5K1I2P9_9GAMM|nr:DMT family transporter [Halomonas lysinitropha]VVZ94438.1 putative DMT superfamily transporter inner membrane protein [Halomonas lysinitropha]